MEDLKDLLNKAADSLEFQASREGKQNILVPKLRWYANKKIEKPESEKRELVKEIAIKFHLDIMTEGKAKLGVNLKELFNEWIEKHNIKI
jgi:hypothetical protein